VIPELIDSGEIRRVLPLGRYLVTLDEIEAKFAPSTDQNRREIFIEFKKMLGLARQAFGFVCSVWIGGSFITSEKNPHDIDVVLVIHEDAFNTAKSSAIGQFVLNRFSIKHGFGEKVDAYLLGVHPTNILNDRSTYLIQRGYWDQFWSKSRFEDPSDPRAMFPSAGYLEVIVDGFVERNE